MSTLSAFLRMVLQSQSGYMCISVLFRNKKEMSEHWFHMPDEFNAMCEFVESQNRRTDVDFYYCPHLFSEKIHKKEYVSITPSAWADLDSCHPDDVTPKPSMVVETSPGRYQALWLFSDIVPPADAEAISRRIAYAYADQGADKSGWDLTQRLRVPDTINTKYVLLDEPGPVVVTYVGTGGLLARYRPEDFGSVPEPVLADYEKIPFPEVLPEGTGRDIMERYRYKLTQRAWKLYEEVPQGDWSKDLFSLEMLCFEAGMTREEVFKVISAAGCNKFDRDGKSSRYVWADVCRAWAKHIMNVEAMSVVTKTDDKLLTDAEMDRVKDVRTFVEDYIDWASSLGDAATQYHQAGAFVILSALLAGNVSLPTSFGRVIPNLWFMILADTTLTRKSTAMDIAVDLLVEVDSDAIMATDGSIEGLFQGLSTRPGRPSVFLRDEFSGLLDQITKKEYYAGMAEVLTKLYDGKMQKRLLRKETIEVRDPVLVLFTGGIKKRVQQLLTYDQISSGFIPRFLFITAESDPSRVMPLGPPTDMDTTQRDILRDRMGELSEFYHQTDTLIIGGNHIVRPRKWDASLTDDAWQRYNEFEAAMMKIGLASERPDLMTPLFDRLAKSTLKAMILLAASRQREEKVLIDVDDVLLGIRYAMGWMDYAIDIVNGIGMSAMENQLDSVLGNIKRNPGISRAALMRNYHLTSQQADAIFTTLEQRGLITKSQMGRGHVYNAA